jgi:hypothetical protein
MANDIEDHPSSGAAEVDDGYDDGACKLLLPPNAPAPDFDGAESKFELEPLNVSGAPRRKS